MKAPRSTLLTNKIECIVAEFGLRLYVVHAQSPLHANGGEVLASNWHHLTPGNAIGAPELLEDLRHRFANSVLPVVRGNFLFEDRCSFEQGSTDTIMFDTIAFTFVSAVNTKYIIAFSVGALTLEAQEIALIYLRSIQAIESVAHDAPMAHIPLTSRELQCLRWAAAGKSSIEIGMILDLSQHTVNTYLGTSIKKLNVANRTQAVAEACRRHLI